MENQKYTTHKEVAHRLALEITSKPIYEYQVVEWSQELETDILGEYSHFVQILEQTIQIDTVTKKALMPANVYRILDIYTDPDNRNSVLRPQNLGTHLQFDSDTNNTSAYIDYLGMPFYNNENDDSDEMNGFPLIFKDHVLACVAYCRWKLFYEDYLLGKIHPQAWQDINMRKEAEIIAALSNSSRNETIRDKEDIQIIRANLVPNYGRRAQIKRLYGTD